MNSLMRLKMEKQKLSTYCTYQEKLIGLKVDHFRENYPKILGDTLLPSDRPQNAWVSGMLDSVIDLIVNLLPGKFEGKRWTGIILKLVETLIIRMMNKKG